MKRDIKYISIQEARHLYLIPVAGKPFMETTRTASIHEIMKDGFKSIRIYGDISDASILRLAKIQEKLAG
jgi:hypothetical protein